jgi:xylulokinase
MTWALGIDLGTSACKATLLGVDGSTEQATVAGYSVDSPLSGWAEQDPAEWWAAITTAVRKVVDRAGARGSDIVAIGLTGQMHSLVLLDRDAHLLRPAILWSDRRSAAEVAEATRLMPELPSITCNPLIPAFTLAHLLWVRRHEPASFAGVAHVLLPKDWVRLQLVGAYATDNSDASGTSLFDVPRSDWSDAILERFQIQRAWLPDAGWSTRPTGALKTAAAAELGLSAGIPVFAGAADQAAQAVASGVIDPGIVGISIGTSGVVVEASSSPRAGAFCHAAPDRWLRLDSMHAAGGSLNWYRDTFEPGRTIEDLLGAVATMPARPTPVFLPFVGGLRDDAGGGLPAAFVDFNGGHRREDYVRAILDGVACELRRMIEGWHGDHRTASYVVSGGGARSALWRQVLADVLGSTVELSTGTPADGAALIAGVGVGWWPSLRVATATTKRGATTDPTTAGNARMAAVYARYLDRVARLRSSATEASTSQPVEAGA